MMLIRLVLFLAALFVAHSASAKQTLTVLTAYPEDVVGQFETAFEREHPDIDVQIIWRMPHDALPYLRQPKQGGVDVYWSASLRTFLQLKSEGAWQKLAVDESGLPERLGAMPLADSDGYFRATETAGYGFAINPAYLKKHGLPTPKAWSDMTDVRYSGHIALPVPSRFGFAPMMIDSVLQQCGWEKGWALLSELTGNARLLEHNHEFVTDSVGSGESGIVPSLDFFVVSAQANGAQLQFVYPEPVAFSPAHIAVTASTEQPEAARLFVAFILSEQGQKLLFHPDIRKLPIRPSVYRDKPAGQFDPFDAAAKQPPVYDPTQTLTRLALVGAAFDLSITEPHEHLRELWRRLREAEKQSGKPIPNLAEARKLLTEAPIDEAAASDTAVQKAFARRKHDVEADRQAKRFELDWRAAIADRYRRAERLLTAASDR